MADFEVVKMSLFALAKTLLFFHRRILHNIKFLHKYKILQNLSKLLINNPHNSLTDYNIPKTSNNTYKQSNKPSYIINTHFISRKPYTCKERHSLLSEPLEPVVRHAPLSEPQYQHIHHIYPSLQQDLNRTRHPSQNQNTPTTNKQMIHPKRNRNFATPRVHFNITSSPIANPLDLSTSTTQRTPKLPQNKIFQIYHRIF